MVAVVETKYKGRGYTMPAYQFKCTCGNQKEVITKISERPNELDCECGLKMARDFSRSNEALIVIHDCDGPMGLKYARMQNGNNKPKNTTKGFSEGVYEASDGKYHDYSRYYLKNTPQIDPRVISKEKNEKKKGG